MSANHLSLFASAAKPNCHIHCVCGLSACRTLAPLLNCPPHCAFSSTCPSCTVKASRSSRCDQQGCKYPSHHHTVRGPSHCNPGHRCATLNLGDALTQALLTPTRTSPPPLDVLSPQRGIALYNGEVEHLEAASVASGPGGLDPAPVTNMMKLQLGYAKRHASVIAQWGRFPHRCMNVCENFGEQRFFFTRESAPYNLPIPYI